MYRIIINDLNTFIENLKLSDSEYVDVTVNDKICYMILYSRSMFVHFTLPAIGDSSENFTFRVKRQILINLSINGAIEVIRHKDYLELIYLYPDGQISSKGKIKEQLPNSTAYEDKLTLLNSIDFTKQEFVDFGQARIINRVGRMLDSLVNLGAGKASVVTIYGIIFQKMETNFNFSVSGKDLNNLLKINSNITSIQNYVCSINENVVAITNKCRGFDNSELEIVDESKSKFKCKININDYFFVINKLKQFKEIFTIDLNSGFAEIEMPGYTSQIPITITDVQGGLESERPTLKLDPMIVKLLISGVKDQEYTLCVKKGFTTLNNDEITLVL